jgi:hypothetical protein
MNRRPHHLPRISEAPITGRDEKAVEAEDCRRKWNLFHMGRAIHGLMVVPSRQGINPSGELASEPLC